MSQNPALENAQALGRLEGGVLALKDLIGNLTEAIDGDRAEAFRQRNEASQRLAHMEVIVASLRADMDLVKPFTEKLQRWQLVGFGALLTVGGIGSVIGSAVTYFKAQIATLFH